MSTKGCKKNKSIIHEQNLEDIIMELHTRGMSYSEICRTINDETGLHINRMQISRYLSKITPEDMKQNVITNLSSIRSRAIENNIRILSNYDSVFNDILNFIETSHLNHVERGILKKQVNNKMKQLRKNLVDSRGEILDTFQAINSTVDASNQFLNDVSNMLCSDCRRKVVKAIQDIEETGNINYNT
jgi:hypothetical protein